MSERTNQDHNTPECVLEVVRRLGPITLDPCSNPWSTVGALVSLSAHRGEDGLEASWVHDSSDGDSRGVVFVNPPYARGQVIRWVRKIAAEVAQNEHLEAILLVPGDDSTDWTDAAVGSCAAYCDPSSRIAFVGAGGSGAKAPSRLYYWGPRRYLFAHVFEELGRVRVFDRRAA